MKQYFQKSISIIVMFLLLGQQVVFAISSGSVVSDPGNQAVNTVTSINTKLQTGQSFKMTLKEFGLDAVAYALAAQMGKRMSNMILNKATGGASGDKPEQYVTNFTELLKNKNQTEVKKYITQLDALSEKNPFARDISKKLVKQSQGASDILDSSLTKFNLDKVIGLNWQDFKYDARVGGWNGYIAAALPQNNPYGAEILAAEDIARKIGFENEAEKLKLLSPGINPSAGAKCDLKVTQYENQIKKQVGQIKTNVGITKQGAGLLSEKKRLEAQKANLQNQTDTVKLNTGSTITVAGNGSSPWSATGTTNNTSSSSQTYQVSNSQIQEIDNKIIEINKQLNQLGLDQTTGFNVAAAGTAGLVDAGGQIDECISDIITSPSSATSALIDSALTYGIEKSQNSQGWKDMLLTAFMSMTQSFLRNGGLSLFKSSGARVATSIPTLSKGGVEDLVDSNGNARSWYDQPDQVVDLPNDFPLAYSFSKSEIETLQKALNTYRGAPNLFSELDQCIPGPDMGYLKRLEDYYYEKSDRIIKRMKEDGRGWFVDLYTTKLDDFEKSYEIALAEIKLYIADPNFNMPGYTIFKRIVGEYDTQKTKYQEVKRQLSERQASLSNLLALNTKIKKSFESLFLRTQQGNFRDYGPIALAGLGYGDKQMDKLVFSKNDWDSLSPEEKKQLVEWAKSFEPKPVQPVKPKNNNTVQSVEVAPAG